MAKSKSKEVRSLQEIMEAAVAKTKTVEVSGPATIKFKQGRMTMYGTEFPGSKLDCIVLASATERAFYSGAYDAANITAPKCYAISDEATGLEPHENVPVENKQWENCKDCPMAVFGTATVGKGPACKTYRRLAVIPASSVDNVEMLPKAQIATCKVSPTSVKNWAAHATEVVTNTGLPVFSVVTNIKCEPDDKTQQKITFRAVKPITDQAIQAALVARLDEATKLVETPYDPPEELEDVQQKSGKY